MEREYDKIDPGQYETRYERIPREGYLHNHWYPLIEMAISKYCKRKMVLDLGCGTGVYTQIVAENTDRVLGLDISEVMLSYAKSRHLNLRLVLADAHHIPSEDKSIDTVVCIGLFEYIQRATVLKEINRVLRSDGICIISVPNRYSAARMPGKIICKILGKRYPCKEPSYREMLRLFEVSGFKVIESRMDDGLIWLPDFLDRLIGKRVYFSVERFFKIFGRNPFSNVMLFVVRKENR